MEFRKIVFVCNGCSEIFHNIKDISREEGFCNGCFNIKEAMKLNKCIKCSEKNPKEENWGMCENCYQEDLDETKERKEIN